jgi:uncharacterized protein YqgC (DUF456 family)
VLAVVGFILPILPGIVFFTVGVLLFSYEISAVKRFILKFTKKCKFSRRPIQDQRRFCLGLG